MDHHQNRAWVLIARKLTGEASEDELQELQAHLEDHPEWQLTFDLTHAYWFQNPGTPPLEREPAWDVDAAVDRIVRSEFTTGRPEPETHHVAPVRRYIGKHPVLWASAAAFVLAVIGLAVLRSYHRPAEITPTPLQAIHENRIETRPGSRSRLLLPDGSTVWVNAGSTLTYPSSFSSLNRECTLEGEAFFDIVKNPAHPFIVHTSSLNIRVLGTAFNVKAYSRDKTIETTLIRGCIAVSIKSKPNEEITLKPNEKLVVANNDSTLQTNMGGHRTDKKTEEAQVNICKPTYESHTGTIIETSWVNNKLIFQDEEFRDLALQMERWYGVDIQFASAKPSALRFTGTFQEETIQQALDALKLTADFNYTIHGNQITIYER